MSITPIEDTKEIERMKGESVTIIDKAKEIANVQNPEGEIRAAEFLKQVKMRMEIADDARTRLVKPLNDHVKMINAEFKQITEPLAEAQQKVKFGLTAYRNSQAVQEAEQRRKETDREMRIAREVGNTEKMQEVLAEHEKAAEIAPKTVSTQSGVLRYRKIWRFEITDLEKLPAGYWMPDDKKIKSVVEAGVEIPGVKAWQEEIPLSY